MSLNNNITIMIVDDNSTEVRLICEALKETGRNTGTVILQNGEEAVKYLKQEERYKGAPLPDIILLDLKMPLMDGHEVLRSIKSDPKISKIPVIIFSSSDAKNDIEKSYELKANQYVTKPLNLEEFFNVIKDIDKKWLDKSH